MQSSYNGDEFFEIVFNYARLLFKIDRLVIENIGEIVQDPESHINATIKPKLKQKRAVSLNMTVDKIITKGKKKNEEFHLFRKYTISRISQNPA